MRRDHGARNYPPGSLLLLGLHKLHGDREAEREDACEPDEGYLTKGDKAR
jgi:hypothetical protein